jgi:hypothetical protein
MSTADALKDVYIEEIRDLWFQRGESAAPEASIRMLLLKMAAREKARLAPGPVGTRRASIPSGPR